LQREAYKVVEVRKHQCHGSFNGVQIAAIIRQTSIGAHDTKMLSPHNLRLGALKQPEPASDCNCLDGIAGAELTDDRAALVLDGVNRPAG